MKFANLTDKVLRFDMSRVDYEVAPGAEVEIPDAIAYGVKSRGLPLTPSSEIEPAAPAPARQAAKAETKPKAEPPKPEGEKPAK
ncbi:MAG: hypothetical protein HOW73_47605 [Polyangiaceae bacterium]|nr:hypothetical protein [Polyangiaceae bacterium]